MASILPPEGDTASNIDVHPSVPPTAATNSSASASPFPLPTLFHHSSTPLHPLTQGAEAHLYLTTFFSPPRPTILKYRPPKPYRHPTLDRRLSRQRILAEARVLVKARREGVRVPGVLGVDAEGWSAEPLRRTGEGQGNAGQSVDGEEVKEHREGRGGWMMIEFIEGGTVKSVLQERRKRKRRTVEAKEAAEEKEAGAGLKVGSVDDDDEEGLRELMRGIGQTIARLHEVGIVHGDLTTSNMILRPAPPSHSISTPTNSKHDLDAPTIAQAKANAAPATTEPTPIPAAGHNPSLQGSIYLIDFGLATQSIQDEDKAVDLYVLERAFSSTHPDLDPEAIEPKAEAEARPPATTEAGVQTGITTAETDKASAQGGEKARKQQAKTPEIRKVGFADVLDAYAEAGGKGARVVVRRLEEVRTRGRKRSMLG